MKTQTTSSRAGVGFLDVIAIVLIALKLANVITWKWVWVVSPIWIPLTIWLLVCVVILVSRHKK